MVVVKLVQQELCLIAIIGTSKKKGKQKRSRAQLIGCSIHLLTFLLVRWFVCLSPKALYVYAGVCISLCGCVCVCVVPICGTNLEQLCERSSVISFLPPFQLVVRLYAPNVVYVCECVR